MTTSPITLLCPGQGAQRVGMGKAWFDSSADAARTFGAADEILANTLPAKLSDICFNGPENHINRTDVAQPALFVAAVASYHALFPGLDPATFAATAGLSLGEYTALHLAGAIAFPDALQLVALRGRAMQDAAEATDSTMVALAGADERSAAELCDRARGPEVLVVANLNAPGQIVVSGSIGAAERAVPIAAEMGFRATRLPVAGAFHSPLMAPAADRLRERLQNTPIEPPRCPVLSNVTGKPHSRNPDDIRDKLVRQLTSPVRWEDCGRWLADRPNAEFHELAPGKVLAGLLRRIDRSLKVTTHDAP